MKTKLIFFTMLLIVLVFGSVFISCGDGSTRFLSISPFEGRWRDTYYYDSIWEFRGSTITRRSPAFNNAMSFQFDETYLYYSLPAPNSHIVLAYLYEFNNDGNGLRLLWREEASTGDYYPPSDAITIVLNKIRN